MLCVLRTLAVHDVLEFGMAGHGPRQPFFSGSMGGSLIDRPPLMQLSRASPPCRTPPPSASSRPVPAPQTGRASCRAKVCKYVYISVGCVYLKQKKKYRANEQK